MTNKCKCNQTTPHWGWLTPESKATDALRCEHGTIIDTYSRAVGRRAAAR
jgi:hypothetical protein